MAYQPKMTVHDPNKRNLNEKLFQELQRQRVGVEGERDSRGEKEGERGSGRARGSVIQNRLIRQQIVTACRWYEQDVGDLQQD